MSRQANTKHGVAVRCYTPPGKVAQGEFALDVATKALDFYDDYFDEPYPLPKLDMVAIPEFAAGAMENWGVVTYREVDLLIDQGSASSQQKQRVASVVTHELAHQWFGNLVTMQWWDRYMQSLCKSMARRGNFLILRACTKGTTARKSSIMSRAQ